jgi:hypothetical protein
MATTYRSKKAKGKRAEQQVAAAYRHYDIDEHARPMPASGAIPGLKGDIFKRDDYGYVDEVKNQETTAIWKWLEQARSQALGLQKPVLHFTRNNSPIYTVLRMEDYMQLRAIEKEHEKCSRGDK